MSRYAVVDPEGNVVNVVLWDGKSKWSPPEGHSIIQHEQAGPGGRFVKRGQSDDWDYIPPQREDEEES